MKLTPITWHSSGTAHVCDNKRLAHQAIDTLAILVDITMLERAV
jgi:hypothetical protein